MSKAREDLVAGLWSWHDASYCVIENGIPLIHSEYERIIREKEPTGDSVAHLMQNFKEFKNIKYFATCCGSNLNVVTPETNFTSSYSDLKKLVEKNNGKIYEVGHHLSHAANAFFSSNLNEAVVITFDGGGQEEDGSTACTISVGKENKINMTTRFPDARINIGKIWSRCTRYIFKMHTAWPYGHKAGTVMALAALGKPIYYDAFLKIMTEPSILYHAVRYSRDSKGNKDPKKGYIDLSNDLPHPVWQQWRDLVEKDEKEGYNIAASLQAATETIMQTVIKKALDDNLEIKNLCLSGGVVLNSVATGKIFEWFSDRIDNIYIPPAPNDAGLTLGASQYVWHHILENPRIKWQDNFTPYLGKKYERSEVKSAIKSNESLGKKFNVEFGAEDKVIIEELNQGKVVSVFGGGSESGKRALGNRSILADPRSETMKDKVNLKVKHREWYRPFAPSILREEVANWFERDIDSPYMSFVFKFKEDKAKLVPAVVHFDNSARLQTVTENDNFWYYSFLKKWQQKSGVPILLNTSFNDREPICETPDDAINCFLKTDIDFLYFFEENILLRKVDDK